MLGNWQLVSLTGTKFEISESITCNILIACTKESASLSCHCTYANTQQRKHCAFAVEVLVPMCGSDGTNENIISSGSNMFTCLVHDQSL